MNAVLSLIAAVVLAGGSADADALGSGAPVREPVELAQLTIEQRVIMRVPMPPPPRAGGPIDRNRMNMPPPETEWEEHKGPKCVTIRSLRGAAVTSRRGVDFMLRDKSRVRARLDKSCRPADFYSGFCIEPTADGTLCAERDELLARSGMRCEIESFRKLVPDKP